MAKKFEFRLERVLRYRKQRQQQAEMQQRDAQNQMMTARETEDAVLGEFNRAAGMPTVASSAFDPGALMNALNHLGEIDVRLKEARQQVAVARDSLHQAETRRTQATKETEALNTLRDQKLAEHRRENELEAQEAVDENVLRKWSRSQVTNFPDAHAAPGVNTPSPPRVDFDA